jgi:hypothetical protein
MFRNTEHQTNKRKITMSFKRLHKYCKGKEPAEIHLNMDLVTCVGEGPHGGAQIETSAGMVLVVESVGEVLGIKPDVAPVIDRSPETSKSLMQTPGATEHSPDLDGKRYETKAMTKDEAGELRPAKAPTIQKKSSQKP